jgi:hypothetical protein
LHNPGFLLKIGLTLQRGGRDVKDFLGKKELDERSSFGLRRMVGIPPLTALVLEPWTFFNKKGGNDPALRSYTQKELEAEQD